MDPDIPETTTILEPPPSTQPWMYEESGDYKVRFYKVITSSVQVYTLRSSTEFNYTVNLLSQSSQCRTFHLTCSLTRISSTSQRLVVETHPKRSLSGKSELHQSYLPRRSNLPRKALQDHHHGLPSTQQEPLRSLIRTTPQSSPRAKPSITFPIQPVRPAKDASRLSSVPERTQHRHQKSRPSQ